MTGVCSSFPVKFAMNPLKMASIADPLTRLGWIQPHGLQVSDTKIFDDVASSSSNATQAPLLEVGPKLIIQKVLCRTDIPRRLVLSKNEAEANMPSLAANEERPMHLYDKLTGRFWEFMYRCWESSKGKVRSYYIENTGEYFRRHGFDQMQTNDISRRNGHSDNQVQESSCACSNLQQQPVQETKVLQDISGVTGGADTGAVRPVQYRLLSSFYIDHFKRASDPRFVFSSKLINRLFQPAMT